MMKKGTYQVINRDYILCQLEEKKKKRQQVQKQIKKINLKKHAV
jgi:hypothetical protein